MVVVLGLGQPHVGPSPLVQQPQLLDDQPVPHCGGSRPAVAVGGRLIGQVDGRRAGSTDLGADRGAHRPPSKPKAAPPRPARCRRGIGQAHRPRDRPVEAPPGSPSAPGPHAAAQVSSTPPGLTFGSPPENRSGLVDALGRRRGQRRAHDVTSTARHTGNLRGERGGDPTGQRRGPSIMPDLPAGLRCPRASAEGSTEHQGSNTSAPLRVFRSLTDGSGWRWDGTQWTEHHDATAPAADAAASSEAEPQPTPHPAPQPALTTPTVRPPTARPPTASPVRPPTASPVRPPTASPGTSPGAPSSGSGVGKGCLIAAAIVAVLVAPDGRRRDRVLTTRPRRRWRDHPPATFPTSTSGRACRPARPLPGSDGAEATATVGGPSRWASCPSRAGWSIGDNDSFGTGTITGLTTDAPVESAIIDVFGRHERRPELDTPPTAPESGTTKFSLPAPFRGPYRGH